MCTAGTCVQEMSGRDSADVRGSAILKVWRHIRRECSDEMMSLRDQVYVWKMCDAGCWCAS